MTRIAAASVLSLLALLVACGGSDASPTEPSPAAQASPTEGTVFSVTEDDKVRAIRIAGADPRIADLIERESYGIGRFLPWTTEQGPDTGPARKFGVTMEIVWEGALTLDYEWPSAFDRPFYSHWASQTEFPPFDEQVFAFTARGVTGLALQIDFDSNRIVGISPQPYTEIDQPAIATRELTDEEKAKTTGLFEDDARIRELLSGRDHDVRLVTHWFLKDRSLGAGIIVVLRQPQSIEFDWPYIDVDESADSYTLFTPHFTAPQVDRLDVLIDLEREEVVAIVPSSTQAP